MNTQNTNAVNPSVILPFSALCNFEVPTTELDPDCVPNVWVIVGEFATFEEAKAACYSHKNHPALIAMQVHQSMCADDYVGRVMTTKTNATSDSASDEIDALLSQVEATTQALTLECESEDLTTAFALPNETILKMMLEVDTQLSTAQAALKRMAKAQAAGGAK